MKRIPAVILVVVLLLSLSGLAACNNNNPAPAGPAQQPAPGSSSSGSSSSGTGPAQPAPQAEKEKYHLSIAMTPTSMLFANDISDVFSRHTDGRVTADVLDVNSLGSITDAVNMVRDGVLDIAFIPTTLAPGEFPVLDICAIPFFTKSYDCAVEIVDALVGAGLLDECYKKTHMLYYTSTESNVVGFTKGLVPTKMSDFAGLKIRSNAASLTDYINEVLKGTAVNIATNDVYLSLSTGVVDATFNSPNNMLLSSYADVMDTVMRQRAFANYLICLVNADLWASFDSELQTLMMQAGKDKAEYIREFTAAVEQDNFNALAEAGVNVFEANDELLKNMIDGSLVVQDIVEAKLNSFGIDGARVMEVARAVAAKY
ncbi:MAG: TRAP transporter substrate-binding protein DctP [Oscillospiraceae bacterium]|nr:TRAP transporter substrate-binding protein DctP [Oscillospiraceae bacterium]